MILHRKGSRWALNPFKVKYTQHGEELEKYDHDKEWWLGFEERWGHTKIIEFVDVEYTEAQISRFEDVQHMPEDFGHIYSQYVKTGEFIDELPKNHPFNLLKLRKENELQGIDLTQREINEMTLGFQVSELEIRLMMGGL